MRTLASVIQDKALDIAPERAGPWLWGWEVWRDPANVVRFTNDAKDFTLAASLVFSHRAFSLVPPQSDLGGGNYGWKVSIDNRDRFLTGMIGAGELKGQPTALYRCSKDHLDALDKAVIWRARIVGISGDRGDLSFSCGLYPLEGVQIPGRKWTRLKCHHKYSAPGNRNDTCAYAGAITTCKKTEADCVAHNNRQRFGAFPNMPVQRP